MSTKFEDEYLDVLQNIEFALANVYRVHAEMTDYDALKALDALIHAYKDEAASRPAPELRLQGLALEAFVEVQTMCEWRLGRSNPLQDRKSRPHQLELEPKTVDEIIACLKRVRRSVENWNKRGGRRGYFDFIDQFIK